MRPLDLHTLALQVRAILAHPQGDVPPTNRPALDRALATLARHWRSGEHLVWPDNPFWQVTPEVDHASHPAS